MVLPIVIFQKLVLDSINVTQKFNEAHLSNNT